jgi:hypothetical protein
MAKKTKKMKAVPSTEVVEKTYYTTLTEEQYDTLTQIVSWNNPLDKLENITSQGEMNNIEMGYKLGKLYCQFEETFGKMRQILDEIEPISYEEYLDESDDDIFNEEED